MDTERIIIIGGGPVGIEAALYGRFLGYDVTVLEKGMVGEQVQSWGHVKMFSPFGMNSSRLGRSALLAQSPDLELPDEDELIDGERWLREYIIPLATSDLLSNSIRTGSAVKSVGRTWLSKGHLPSDERDACEFRVLAETPEGEEVFNAEYVIDASGVLGQPRHLGAGGVPAIGESAADVFCGVPNSQKCEQMSNARILVVGNGHSAATTINHLQSLNQRSPETQISWVVRQNTQAPIKVIDDDPLSHRHEIATSANAAVRDGNVDLHPHCTVDKISGTGPYIVTLLQWDDDDDSSLEIEVDFIIKNTGYRPDMSILTETQVHLCYATDGPIKLAAQLLGNTSDDCTQIDAGGADTLLNPEPDLFVLGSKSFGRNSNFLFSTGLNQIRDAFTIIGQRDDLDLYETIEPT
ncbi:MAG TPA: hypothetical protein DCP67_01535 [Planctomycetaceae bacterium]|nr:hypothetical protein [Planctomycetaceae bacterium]